MAEFVLLLGGNAGWDASAAELGVRTGRLATWVTELKATGVATEVGTIDGPALRVHVDEQRTVTLEIPDDVGESLRCWVLLRVPDLETAVAVVASCPETPFADTRLVAIEHAGRSDG